MSRVGRASSPNRGFYGSEGTALSDLRPQRVIHPREWDLPASFARSLLAGAGFEGVAAGRGVVRRPGLLERLLAARAGGVVLVCAPAGSGKSVLVRSWAEAEGLGDRVAWVSVEPGEPDGQRFWLSVIDALARVAASVEKVAPAPVARATRRRRATSRTSAARVAARRRARAPS